MGAIASCQVRPHVLIVEDEPLVAWDLERMLKDGGYLIAGLARSVDAALDVLSVKKVDVAVLDVNLTSHLSVPLTFELRRRNIPFVVCTAYSSLLDSEKANLEGVKVLSKPVREDSLVSEIDRLTNRHAS